MVNGRVNASSGVGTGAKVAGLAGLAMLVALFGAVTAPAVSAQSGKATTDGVYSEAQATRGAALSTAQCTVCHGAQLEGTDVGPGLAGSDFQAAWNGRSLFELFDKIKSTMPANAPGELTEAQTADLVAHILKLNEYPTATADLAGDKASLDQIKVRQK